MHANNIAQIGYLNALQHGMKRIFFSGGFLQENPYIWETFSYGINFWSKGNTKAMFLMHNSYLGSLGGKKKNRKERKERKMKMKMKRKNEKNVRRKILNLHFSILFFFFFFYSFFSPFGKFEIGTKNEGTIFKVKTCFFIFFHNN